MRSRRRSPIAPSVSWRIDDSVQCLAELAPERRAALETGRQTILAHLPPRYEEAMNWGMITCQVPLAT